MRRFDTFPAPVIGWPVCVALVALMVIPVTAVDQTWPTEAYRVEWEEAHIPEEAAANVTISVPVTLRNNGDRVWPASQVLVSYHWFRDGKLVVWDGERPLLPLYLRAGSRATGGPCDDAVEPIGVLTVTLVHELVTWFEHKGAAVVSRPIAVRRLTRTVDGSSSGRTP